MPSIVSGPFTVSRSAAMGKATGVPDVVIVNRDSGFAGTVTTSRETAIPGSADRAITLFTDISRLAIAPASNPGELNIRLSGLVAGFVGGANKEAYRKLAHALAQEIFGQGGIVLHGERALGISAAVTRGAGRNGLEIVFAEQPNGAPKNRTKPRQPATARANQEKLVVSSVFAQLQLLTTIPSVVIALPGKIDTMYGWMTTLFSTNLTNKNGIWRPPLLFLHDDWRELVDFLKTRGVISDELLVYTRFFTNAKEVTKALEAHKLLDGKPEKREK